MLSPLVWLHIEQQPIEKISNHAWYTFWYVVLTLPMFLLFPVILHLIGFWWPLAASCALTAICFLLFGLLSGRFGMSLW
jgi:hypothetical protein